MDAQINRSGELPHARRPVGGAVSVDFEAGPEAAAWARNALFAVENEVEDDLMADIRLLVSELVTNSVRHSGVAPPDSVGLDVAVDEETIRVEVRDRGQGFEPRKRDPNRTRPGGWGLYLVERLADRWGVVRNHFTSVWFEIDRRPRVGHA